MLSTRRQLEILVLVAITCQLVGIRIGWTWYLWAVYLAALLGFCAMSGVFWWGRRHDQTERSRRSPRDYIGEQTGLGQTVPESVEDQEAIPSSIAVNRTPTEPDRAAVHQFLVRRVVGHILVSLVIFGMLVALGCNPFIALGAVLAGGLIAHVLQLVG